MVRGYLLELPIPSTNRMKRGNVRRNNRVQGVMEVRTISAVPPYRSNPELTVTLRFVAIGSGGTFPITRANLLATYLINLATGTQNARLIAAVRWNSCKIYAGLSNVTGSSTASLEWLSNLGPTSERSVTGSATSPGILVTSPPRSSTAGFWSITGQTETEVLANMTVGGGDFVDVNLSFVMYDGESPVIITTGSSGVAAATYRSYFDGPRTSAILQPVSVLFLN